MTIKKLGKSRPTDVEKRKSLKHRGTENTESAKRREKENKTSAPLCFIPLLSHFAFLSPSCARMSIRTSSMLQEPSVWMTSSLRPKSSRTGSVCVR